MAVPARLELATFGLGNRCSIRLSYGTVEWCGTLKRTSRKICLVNTGFPKKDLRQGENSADRRPLPGHFFVHCHLPATFLLPRSAMSSIVSPIEGQFLGRLGPRFGEVPVSWPLRWIRFGGHLLFRPSAAAGGPHGRATHPSHSRLVAQRRGALIVCARRALAAALAAVYCGYSAAIRIGSGCASAGRAR